MKTNSLGRTGIEVSQICLGTMTWGTQNSEAEAHAQMDYAVENGVNFFDTAEMYPVTPLSAETYGRTEEYVGTWFGARKKRDDIVLATKIAGPGRPWVRDGKPITPQAIRTALDASLKRLKTDYIDLYQIHWPNRGHFHFRNSWTYTPYGQDRYQSHVDIAETLDTLDRLVKAGKIRAIGLSNETAWGTMRYLNRAEQNDRTRISTVQNEYSLLYRHHDLDMAELAYYEDVGLLAFSPLATGLLTGKYLGGKVPAGSRASIQPELGGRRKPQQEPAVEAYMAVAEKHGLDPAQMALAFVLSRPFVTAAIIGATSMEQLKINIAARELTLSEAVLDDIARVHRQFPMPI
ncbi:aldo/keto reductase [Martelella radicis]|uniref:Aryl-alcohol dehydrogenase-like predicted oxidoreductase n=1 Tax=Martelella radicis TaxID=1397476 RepID=A0A7W6KHZ9_9HYPH|nr:aldo/keto reductase [Martelella radicis]MBB4120559.1 aryl-alcohol dehydrogenase-like predicted oxidoreductase [Martelella radicis]